MQLRVGGHTLNFHTQKYECDFSWLKPPLVVFAFHSVSEWFCLKWNRVLTRIIPEILAAALYFLLSSFGTNLFLFIFWWGTCLFVLSLSTECACRVYRNQYVDTALHCLLCLPRNNVVSLMRRGFVDTELVRISPGYQRISTGTLVIMPDVDG